MEQRDANQEPLNKQHKRGTTQKGPDMLKGLDSMQI